MRLENSRPEPARPCSFPVWRIVFKVPEVFQNVTKTLGFYFYSGLKRNVWHRRWAKFCWKIVLLNRPSHAVPPAAEMSFLNGFFMCFLMLRGEICLSMVSQRQGTGVWRNQNVTKTLGFYSGCKRNVWHRRWAKCGLKMVFVSRPGHAVSPFWRFFFKVPKVFRVHNFHKAAKTSIIVSKPYNFFTAFRCFFDDEEKSAFPWYLSVKVLEWCQNCRFMGVKKAKRDRNPRFL